MIRHADCGKMKREVNCGAGKCRKLRDGAKGRGNGMAKYEKVVYGDFDWILDRLDKAVMSGSTSASYEDGSSFTQGDFRCEVRVYERYSWTGGNRVSMAMTLAGSGGEYFLSVITSGGSQGMFFKVNTLGEESFLETIAEVVDSL